MGSKGFTEAGPTSQWCIIAEDDAMVFGAVAGGGVFGAVAGGDVCGTVAGEGS